MDPLPRLAANDLDTPAIFSDSLDFSFTHDVSGDEIRGWLGEFAERLAGWAKERGHFVGHIKLFAETANAAFWVATTGKQAIVQVKTADPAHGARGCSVDVTAILFGADPDRVQTAAYALLHDRCPGHLAF